MIREMYFQQWNEAVDNFIIKQYVNSDVTTYIHAEADTGSKYEVFSTLIKSLWRNQSDLTCFVTVANPWERVWTSPFNSWAYPDYVREHWGHSRALVRTDREVHGGDLAAMTMCVNMALGHSLDEVVAKAREWGS